MTPSGPNPSSKAPTPLPLLVSNPISLGDHKEKKRKREKRHGKGVIKEGEVQEVHPLRATKVARTTCQ
nr:hypothetical protein CFP56_07086 [Quercus suber]